MSPSPVPGTSQRWWTTLSRRLWMRSLIGQWIVVMLVTLAASQGLFLLFYRNEAQRVLREVRRDDFLARSAAVARVVATTDSALHAEILRAANTTNSRYWLSTDEPAEPVAWQGLARGYLLAPRKAGVAAPGPAPTAADFPTVESSAWEELHADEWTGEREARFLRLDPWNGFGIAIRIHDGLWLQTAFARSLNVTTGPLSFFYVSFIITALLLSAVSVLAVRRMGRPLRRLTDSVERLGRGEEVEPLPEDGAEDLRRTSIAFNRMQERIRSFVADRTLMLAAISHDLRTPITSMRLRAEFVEDQEVRHKLIATLDEMKSMTEASLAFAREEGQSEPTRAVDLDALVESLCDDLAELGWDVRVEAGERIPWRCRPDALRRALRNVIENAVRYGDRARVRLALSAERLAIEVDDDGPGIPEADRERVFTPFVRLEGSRNRSTGGVGLGLSIARTIVRAHGGDVLLANRPEGGLRTTIRLPRDG